MSGIFSETNIRNEAAAVFETSSSRIIHVAPHSVPYYSLCVVGGILSSSIRWIKTPLDNVKCNMQVFPSKFPSFRQGLATIYQMDGFAGLYRGLVPTMLAYGTQTGIKYGMYEVLKDKITNQVDAETARKYRGLIYIFSAAAAESMADVLMCPWEMLKIRVQTDPTFPQSFRYGLRTIRTDPSFPFGSLGPLLARQLPTTILNFYTFENAADFIYVHLLQKSKGACDTSTQLGVTLAAGYAAGLVSTVCTHIPDSLVSLKSKPEFANSSLIQISREVGFYRLATNGLGPRVVMTGSIIAFQWFFYNSFKSYLGLGTTGG